MGGGEGWNYKTVFKWKGTGNFLVVFPKHKNLFCCLACGVLWQNLRLGGLGFNLYSLGYTNIPHSPNLLGSWL